VVFPDTSYPKEEYPKSLT